MVSFDEIRQLQEELEQAQSTAAATKLSRRNCVQIVMKLQETGLIELYYTLDGKEYITPQQLEREIHDEIIVHNGRITVTDLQELLNVDISHIERKLQAVLNSDHSLHRVQSEIVSELALDNIALEANQIVQDAGRVELGHLCKRFALPVEFLVPHLQNRVGSIIQAELVEGGHAVVTNTYKTRQKHRVRGYFSGVTKPVALSQAAQHLDMSASVVQTYLSALVSSGRLKGSTANSMYFPAIHSRAQERWMDNFFASNGYLEYSQVAKLGIAKAQDVVKRRFPDAIPLHTCVVAEHTIETLDATLEEMLFGDDAEPFVDALPLLPSACSDDDVPQLLSRCANMGARTDVQILADTIVTTTEFIDACREKIEALMPERLQGIDLKAAKDAVESAAQGGTNTANDDDEDNGLSGKSKRRGRKKKSGGGASAKGKKGKSAAPSTDILNFMSLDEMSAFITKAFPDTEDHPGLADEIAAKLHAPLSSKFKEMVVARIKSGASGTGRKEARATLERTFSTMYDNIQAFAKTSASLSETDASLSSTLDRHLLRSLCPDLVAVLIKLLALENLIQFDVDKPLSSDERKEILNESAPADKKTFNELLQMCNGKDLAAFQTAMEKVAEDRLQLFIRPFDKKTEKQVLANHRAGLAQMVDALPNTANLGEALLAVITLLFAQQRNECLHAHGRSIPQLLDVLKDDVDEDTFATLKQAQDEVYAQLTKGEDEEPVELTVTVADLKRLVAKK